MSARTISCFGCRCACHHWQLPGCSCSAPCRPAWLCHSPAARCMHEQSLRSGRTNTHYSYQGNSKTVNAPLTACHVTHESTSHGCRAHGGEEAAGLAKHDREALALIAGLGEVAKAAGHARPEPRPREAARPYNSPFGASDLSKMVQSQLRRRMSHRDVFNVRVSIRLATLGHVRITLIWPSAALYKQSGTWHAALGSAGSLIDRIRLLKKWT